MGQTFLSSLDSFFEEIKHFYFCRQENYKEHLFKFFDEILYKCKMFKNMRKQINKFLAIDFNLIKIINPDENKISDIIALLLKPDGEHGQGEIFLEKFLKMLEKLINRKITCELSQVKIIREHATFEGRRIDIFLNFPNGFIIGVENKLWAKERYNQLNDYSEYLKLVSKKDFLLIYFDALGRKSNSIEENLKEKLKKEGKFLEVSYHEFLIPWLEECLKECEAEKVRYFLKDFIAWIKNTFHKEEKMNKDLIKEFLYEDKNKEEKFEIAWDIWKYFEEIVKETVLERVFSPLVEKIKKILPSHFVVSYFDFGSLYITKESWKENIKDRGIVAICIERWFRDKSFIGLVKNKNFKVEVEDVIRKKLSEQGLITTNQWYLGYLSDLSSSISLDAKKYYKTVFVNPNVLVEDYFQAIKRVLEILKNEEILELLDKLVEERKKQLGI